MWTLPCIGIHDRRTLPPPRPSTLARLAAQLRVDSIRCNARAGAGHPTSYLSAAGLIADPIEGNLHSDRGLVSRGHAPRSCRNEKESLMAAPEPPEPKARPGQQRQDDHLPGLGLSGAQRSQVGEFNDPAHELRRLFSETFGTFLLVLAAAGADIIDSASAGAVGRVAAVTAPGLTVMAIILFMGTNSGAHLNPVVTLAFALRRDFPWRRVPGYILAQLAGATTAAIVLRLAFGLQDHLGGTHPSHGFTPAQALVIEVLPTLGLVSNILGAASGAQNIGPLSAL